MGQHFLLSKRSRSLGLRQIARLSEEEAFDTFCKLRWPQTQGEPVCPSCGCLTVYIYRTRKIFKCKACTRQFSVTAGTIFANRKLPISTILFGIMIFANGAKGHSALQLSRELRCQYKTAFVLAHKLREVMADEASAGTVSGVVEVDGAYFGGHVRPANYRTGRLDRRKRENKGKKKVLVIMRERGGRTVPCGIFDKEAESTPYITTRIERGSTVHADEGSAWEPFHMYFDTKRINHQRAYSHEGACTNMAESFFSRIRRAENGTHHHIAGPYLDRYAGEMAWRENNRRISNGEQFLLIVAEALAHPVSRQWKGYWQRRRESPSEPPASMRECGWRQLCPSNGLERSLR